MSISPDYFKYIEHFGQTVTVKELSELPDVSSLIALRHDVDYDIDLALEMSYWENRRGLRSTYYLLHSADYWNDHRLSEKCLQIQDFGHEVGLHLNVLSEWIAGEVEDAEARLAELLAPLRKAGVRLSGVSSHGDPLCYKHQFINYWSFSELRPSDPPSNESGLSAEGIAVKEQEFQITYPESHRLVRHDGKFFNLWSVSMKKLGLTYDASHVKYDFYFTDSGGGWHRSGDPMQHKMKSGRHQVLMHPIYWRGNQKIYFFLSTARSGSKWLSHFLEQATPLKAQHEFSLNHHYEDKSFVEEKRTAEGFTDLLNNYKEAKSLLIDARTWIEEFEQDYGEANVYLERFLPLMKEVFPDAMLIHLHRDPKDVVRSITNRDWYDTPEDTRHPVMKVGNWNSLSQFEKACWYVRETNESLINKCDIRISFEEMVIDLQYLSDKLHSINIPVFPVLAKAIYTTKINQNYNNEFPEYEKWSSVQKSLFHSICDPENIMMGYSSNGSLISKLRIRIVRFFRACYLTLFHARASSTAYAIQYNKPETFNLGLKGCRAQPVDQGQKIIPDGGQHAYCLLGGGRWNNHGKENGWESKIAHYCRGVLDAEVNAGETAQLFSLMYGSNGKLIAKRSLGQIKQSALPLKFSFKSRSNAYRFNLAIYMSKDNLPDRVVIRSITFEVIPL